MSRSTGAKGSGAYRIGGSVEVVAAAKRLAERCGELVSKGELTEARDALASLEAALAHLVERRNTTHEVGAFDYVLTVGVAELTKEIERLRAELPGEERLTPTPTGTD